ncbi:hypothetical protein A3I56_01130 [Candidatus Roizmanbacteria bacterium RIFCSPLOWO2_02_FULL_43_10]|uniref:Tc1-like transposase DDE domain-containing protein n=1 Tax=Candidatus Roizmanbacteria bacterium RIFCSPLOWO2_02_FULL_43_10 TaxID=1802078 RepID=A0A1F7JWY3_9BACT|nr:MAG: hypothetical protein A3I56_01130 [Candidatus Roizmanbacteria bacterium RIFCSPLOWO2_02_FULL_43_10]
MKIEDIAEVLGRNTRTVARWIHGFKHTRLASLFTGHKDNENASKLTREQKKEIKKVLSEKPSVYGLPKEFWDSPQLKTYVKAEFGIVYESERSYHYLLQFSNLSFKQPAVFDVRRDEIYIKEKIAAIRKKIIPLMRRSEWVILASDETRIMCEAITRRAWLQKGEKTVLKVERSHESQYYIGFLNLKTGKDHLIPLTWGNEKEIIKAVAFVAKLYPDKKICIVWDNVSFHKGKALQEKLKKDQPLERIHLINFPPYAPDFNPQELVWNAGKGHIANKQFKTFVGTKQSFTRFVSTHIFNYSI